MSSEVKVRFEPDGIEATAPAALLISEIAHQAGIGVHLPCGGRGSCGKCTVTVKSGEMSPPTESEDEALDDSELRRGLRLACQARVLSDAVIEVPPETRVIGTKDLNGDLSRSVPLKPNVRQIPVELSKPDLEDQRSDFDRLAEELERDVPRIIGCPPALQNLPRAMRDGDFKVVASIVGDRLVDVHPGSDEHRILGVAVDIGTTTVVAYVVDLMTGEQMSASASYNSQGQYGADVISRIDHCNTQDDGLEEMRGLAVQTINATIQDALDKCGCKAESIYEITVVGNTAMNHLFLGLDPRYVAQAPYVPVSSRPQELRPSQADLTMHPRGRVFCLPIIAGFVGADTVGVILATRMTQRGYPVLAVDIGTNGEIALWSGKELLVASCAAGPAFEGAQIEHGMRAAPGAIEAVSTSNGDISVQTIDNAPAVGICGSGLFDAMAVVLELGVVDQSGRFVDGNLPEGMPESIRRRIVGEGNERRFIFNDPGTDSPVSLSQRDVRELQLAKGAVRAAIDLLLQCSGLTSEDLGEVLLAGAFGNYINPASALRMGMLPDIPIERIKGVGNAAGAGAVLSLISTDERKRAIELAASARHIELSRKPEFQMAFMETMLFP